MTIPARMVPFLPALIAAALAVPSHGLSIKPSPPPQPPKSLSSRPGSGRPTTPKSHAPSSRSGSPLRAYTVADGNNSNNWLSLLKIPKSWDDFTVKIGAAEDSLFSFEGGSAMKAATRPLMPNLEVEATMGTKDELLSELTALTKTFSDLESSMDKKSQLYEETIKSYEFKVKSLEEKNVLLEEGLNRLTMTLERQDQQLRELKQGKNGKSDKEDVDFDNEMLRRRVRALEVELSDIAFESRKLVPAPSAAVEDTFASTQTNSASNSKLSPMAPSAPVPPHIYQQNQLEKLQLQVEKYERERSSLRKLVGLGLRRALNLWSPITNLLLWGEMRGQMIMV